jgi:hypothetical protein
MPKTELKTLFLHLGTQFLARITALFIPSKINSYLQQCEIFSPFIFCGAAEPDSVGAVGAGFSLRIGVGVVTAGAGDGAGSSLGLVAVGALPPPSTGMGPKPEQQNNARQ